MTNTATRLYKGTPVGLTAPSYRGSAFIGQSTIASTTRTITLPTYAAGDTVILQYANASGLTVVGPATGWVVGGQTGTLYIAYKAMTDTSQTTFSFTVTNGSSDDYVVTVYQNADTPIMLSTANATLGSNAALPTLSTRGLASVYAFTAGLSNSNTTFSTSNTPYSFITRASSSSFPSYISSDVAIPANAAAVSPSNLNNSAGLGTVSYVALQLANTGAINVPAGSTLYTATSKTIITSISAGGGLTQSGVLRLTIAGVDFIRDISVGGGSTSLFSPNHVIESGETITAYTDTGTVPVIISGVVIT